ncbi:hypothetical protein MHYP_G00271120 [Metynnis hypsauchen]
MCAVSYREKYASSILHKLRGPVNHTQIRGCPGNPQGLPVSRGHLETLVQLRNGIKGQHCQPFTSLVVQGEPTSNSNNGKVQQQQQSHHEDEQEEENGQAAKNKKGEREQDRDTENKKRAKR